MEFLCWSGVEASLGIRFLLTDLSHSRKGTSGGVHRFACDIQYRARVVSPEGTEYIHTMNDFEAWSAPAGETA